ncbi:hypothetical protein ONZ45_g16690 [Pleurotus djamor]|nr:hypothetical protein ONZ45_g16690 [Pleurotus djamor]
MTKPKAKITATATSVRKAASVVSTTSKSSTVAVRRERSVAGINSSPTPRPTSPFKSSSLKPPERGDSPTHSQPRTLAKVRTLRPQTAHSVIGISSEPRQRSLTSVASDAGPLNRTRARHGSVSLQHAASLASLHQSQPSSRSASPVAPPSRFNQTPEPDASSVISGVKIKAKVSGLAKQVTTELPNLPSNSQGSLRSPPGRPRAPSASSVVLSSTPPSPNLSMPIYPITTATPAANPHRYAPSRPSPPSIRSHHYQPFRAHNNNDNRSPTASKVDPASIPLPPQSPPMSSLSVSSKSSVSISRSSVQYAPSGDSNTTSPSNASTPHLNGKHEFHDHDRLRSTLDDLVRHVEMSDANVSGDSDHALDDDEDGYNDERQARARAKSDRKIEDLEISNRSLLAINASLEATKHKQAKEIRELRRKLRESRLILPPQAYRAVKSSYGPDDEPPDDEDDDDDDSEPEDSDVVYKRIKSLIDDLLRSGKQALESKTEPPKSAKGKVLSAEEVKDWQEGSGSDGEPAISSLAQIPAITRPTTPQKVAFFPRVNPYQDPEKRHPLLPPLYLQPHMTVLAKRNPLRESYERVVAAKNGN